MLEFEELETTDESDSLTGGNVSNLAELQFSLLFCAIFRGFVVIDSILGLFISLPSRSTSAFDNFFFLRKRRLLVIC